LAADYLREAIAKSSALHQVLLRYVQVFLRQPTETALANGRGKIEERLARWLLMAHDRVDGDELRLTHEFLAVMGITTALQELERKGLIAHRRSLVTVLDREGLEHASNDTYSRANQGGLE
jgi:CRP-like cAMP-binding protein